MDYFLILDIGTTTVKAFAYTENGEIIKKVEDKAPVMFPSPGWVEQDPVKLWNMVYDAATRIINEFGKPKSIGISTQRASTTVWYKDSGEPLHNMITWQDARAIDIAEEYSNKFILRFGRGIGKLVSFFKKSSKSMKINYLITLSNFRFGPNQPIIHLRWLLDNIENLESLAREGKVLFGTLDTWILYNFLKRHITDYTNASATGMFDPFFMKWSDRLTKLLNIPRNMLPELVDNMGHFGEIKDLDNVPITAIIADQQASLFSAGGMKRGTVKITNGTGSFIDINVGDIPLPARFGLYPLVAFKWRDRKAYLLEGIIQSSGSAIDWLMRVGILKDYEEISKLIKDEETEVLFIPALAGLGAPYWRMNAKGIIYGLTRATERGEIAKALIDGIAFRCYEVISVIKKATNIPFDEIIADGNASRVRYLLERIADFTGLTIKVSKNLEGTSRGTFLIARGGLLDLTPEEAFIPPDTSIIIKQRRKRFNPERWRRLIDFINELA